ncbi:MAG: coproporphyrinogen dehydrogenase HemZ, partial [Ruminococcus sp.]|nr:coproporphyrinogen dehydrogenase HemZ [Ruminococcus sp.]
MNNDSKMPIVLIGNSFKYEIEATVKLFFNTARFSFCTDRSEISGERYIVAEVRENSAFTVEVCLGGESVVTEGKATPDKLEHELCRAIFHTLCSLTGIRPPWGIMTGIRPVKKVTELIERGLDKEQIRAELTERFELLPDKFELAYKTAVNQLPILEKIDRSAASLYVSIPFCPTRCSYCSFVSHSMDSARKLMPEYIAA